MEEIIDITSMKWNGHKLDQVKEEKDLGVLIDDELKFHKQTAAVIKKRLTHLDSITLPLLYKSLGVWQRSMRSIL